MGESNVKEITTNVETKDAQPRMQITSPCQASDLYCLGIPVPNWNNRYILCAKWAHLPLATL